MTFTLICKHCAMQHVVAALERGEDPGPPPKFDESPDEHMTRVHPNYQATKAEHDDLMRRIEALPFSAFELLNHDLGNQTPTKERH